MPIPARGARREIAEYLRAQTAPVHEAFEAYRAWQVQIPSLFEYVKTGQNLTAATKARALGKQYGAIFHHSLEQAEALTPPTPAVRCQEYLIRWLTCLIRACDALSHAPEDGRDTAFLRDAHDYIEDARYAFKPLNEIRQRLYEAARGGQSNATQPPPGRA